MTCDYSCFVIIVLILMQPCVGQSTLENCQLAASAFHSTCDTNVSPAEYVRDVPALEAFSFTAPTTDTLTSNTRYGSYSCPITFDPVDSTVIGDACAWNRRLCVTCSISTKTGRTRIRVQSNGLPDHSYWMESTNPRELNIDFEVDFDTPLVNASHNISNPRLDITSSNDLNNVLCTGTSTSDDSVPNQYGFIHKGDSTAKFTNTFSGVSISGLPIGAALQANTMSSSFMQDSHFPVTGLPFQLDTCLLHGTQNYRQSEGAGALAYTAASPCLFGSSALQNFQKPCSKATGCQNVSSTIQSSYASLGSGSNTTILGIAKVSSCFYAQKNFVNSILIYSILTYFDFCWCWYLILSFLTCLYSIVIVLLFFAKNRTVI